MCNVRKSNVFGIIQEMGMVNSMVPIDKQAAIDAIVDKGATGDSKVKCLSCGHHVAERPFEVYCNIMCKWVNEKDYCAMFEPAHTYER